MEFGTVKWFASKGQPWGYIEKDGGGEIFVHYKQILPDNQEDPKYKKLTPGQRVCFEVGTGYFNPGTQAMQVKIISEPQLKTESGTSGSESNSSGAESASGSSQ